MKVYHSNVCQLVAKCIPLICDPPTIGAYSPLILAYEWPVIFDNKRIGRFLNLTSEIMKDYT